MNSLRKHFSSTKNKRGFSLLELLAVVTLLAILSGAGSAALRSLGQGQGAGTAVEELREAVELARTRSLVTGACHWVGVKPDTDGKNLLVRLYRATDSAGSGSPNPGERYGREIKLPLVRISSSVGAYGSRPAADATLSAAGAWLEVSPSGEVRLDASTGLWSDQKNTLTFQEPPAAMNRWIEIGLAPAVGPADDSAVLQIAGLTGQTEIYRP